MRVQENWGESDALLGAAPHTGLTVDFVFLQGEVSVLDGRRLGQPFLTSCQAMIDQYFLSKTFTDTSHTNRLKLPQSFHFVIVPIPKFAYFYSQIPFIV